MEACKKANVPVVVSPIWISITRALWGSRGTLFALKDAVEEGRTDDTEKINALRNRELVVQVKEGNVRSTGDCDFDNGYKLIGYPKSSRRITNKQLA